MERGIIVKKSVYIETTIVSYLTAQASHDVIRAARRAITKRWWNDRRQDFKLFVSEIVFEEAQKGDMLAVKRRKRVLDRLPRLEISDEAAELAAALIEEGTMPPKAAGDALHLAVAAVQKIDFLLTWNYRHLANAEMMGRMASVVAAKGYRAPVICTPEELMGH
jgi:predicted nucleic acid-binding protein